MNLKDWEENGWIRPHQTSKEEIGNLFNIVKRDLEDAQRKDVSDDWKFGIAYNAALKLCTILLYLSGYRPEKLSAHYRTIQAIPVILGPEKEDDANYLGACRIKRNIIEYDMAGMTSEREALELIEFVKEFEINVLNWIKLNHPEYS
ncbi:MAG: hypothetical protein WC372_08435 [Candidatus Neomarinimicrobiota bacterium]|jgi:hypothetical protein|nr:hypothetical protein [Candidatus Neomarinimicrobiota bacterium]MDD3966639.1 hypothetical protein [Candidatus Neomarinimicrobiota bacterium]MDX9780971.1 hypothetical protein [bacterium]